MFRRLLSPLFLLPLGLVLVVAGAKLALIHYNGSDMPFADQWAAEGDTIYRWYLNAGFEWRFLFFAHGEHTPALTRLIDLGLFVLNGEQWDSRPQMLVSVGLHLLSALYIWQIVRTSLTGWSRLTAVLLAAILLSLPSNQENFLWGFQTLFILLITLGLAHLWGTLRREQIDGSWWLAQLAGFCGLFTIASGWLSALVLAGVAGWRLTVNPRQRWAWATLAVNVALATVGWVLLQRSFHHAGQAVSIPGQFLSALGHYLSWPLPGPFWALLLHLPAALFLWRVRRRSDEGPLRLLAGLIVWTWLLAAAFAYGRGHTPGAVAVRYYDPLAMGLLANGLALAWLAAREKGRPRAAVALLGLGWLLALGPGLWTENRPENLRGTLAAGRDFHERQRRAVLTFLESGLPADLEADPVVRQYLPHFQFTLDVLNDPLTRLALPPSISPPLVLQRARSRGQPGELVWTKALGAPNGRRALVISGGRVGAEFVSLPIIDSGRPVWRFQLFGRLRAGEAEVFLEDEIGRRQFPAEEIVDSAGTWKTFNILRGQGPQRLVARADKGVEFAITEPVEVGWLSWWAPKVASGWAVLLAAGLACLALGAVRSPRDGQAG